jgi:hypothetical protein
MNHGNNASTSRTYRDETLFAMCLTRPQRNHGAIDKHLDRSTKVEAVFPDIRVTLLLVPFELDNVIIH